MRSLRSAMTCAVLATLGAAPGSAVPPPAGTVDLRATPTRTITFAGLSYTPPSVLVSAGQSVAWEGDFAAHPLAPSAAGSPIPEVGIGASASATFTTPASYRYICQYHAGRGMVGTVHVQGVPTAAIAASPARPAAGSTFTLSAAGSDEVNGTITGYRWDLDGDGIFEVDGQSAPTLQLMRAAGVHRLGVQVRDDRDRVASAMLDVTVDAAPAAPQGAAPDPAPQNPAVAGGSAGGDAPQTTPRVAPDTRPPALQATAGPRAIRALRSGAGLPIVLRSDEASNATVTLRLGTATLARATTRLREATPTTLRLRPRPTALAQVRVTTRAIVVVVRIVDGAGNATVRRLSLSPR